MGDDILKVGGAVSAEGAEGNVSLGGGFMGFLARVRPGATLRARGKLGIGGRLLAKFEAGEKLNAAETEYLASVLDKEEARYLREAAVLERAEALLLRDAKNAEQQRETDQFPSDDWMAKFMEDAGLVTDDMLRELYARVLAGNVRGPGSCSLRTLAVLRVMDHALADQFRSIVPLLIDGRWLPDDAALLKLHGVDFDALLELEAAGLVKLGVGMEFETECEIVSTHEHLLCIHSRPRVDCTAHVLRLPGVELARVAEVSPIPGYSHQAAKHLLRTRPRAIALMSTKPPEWGGTTAGLEWSPVAP